MTEQPRRPDRLTGQPDHSFASRRAFLMAAAGTLLAGCANPQRTVRNLPGPSWDARPLPDVPAPEPVEPTLVHTPPPPRSPFTGVLPRTAWASGAPVPALMKPMLPVRYVTVHHDGMRPFYGDDAHAAARRLDAIRKAHRRQRWGDIGYHFAVDRAGNVWQARPLEFQGAHVKYCNEHNIGVVALGNFDRQTPTEAQFAALRRHVTSLLNAYNLPVARLKTHQEWAATACPGRNLQRWMCSARRTGVFA